MTKRLLRLAPLLLVVTCAGAQVSHDYDPETDFSALRSWDWDPQPPRGSGDPQLDSPLLAERIRSAIERTLVERGHPRVEDRTPDFTVTWQLGSERRLDSSGTRARVGVGGSHGGISVGSGDRIREVQIGSLVIDVMTPGSRKLLWRGVGQRQLAKSLTPEESTRAVDEIVGRILAAFPPEPR